MKYLYYIISILPFKWLYFLSDLLCFFLKKFYRKSVVRKNIKNSFLEKTREEKDVIYNKFYSNFCDVFIEIVKGYTITREELIKRVKIENLEEMNQIISEDKPIVIICSHQCNWEWLLLSIGAYFDVNTFGIYKNLTNKTFNDIMYKTRTKFDITMVEAKKSVEYMNNNLHKIKIIGLAADQCPRIDNKVHWKKFLNQETAFYRGIELVPKKINCKVFFLTMRRISRGYYSMKLLSLYSPPYDLNESQILPKYVNFLEKEIYKNPSDWLWSHKRWKQNKR